MDSPNCVKVTLIKRFSWEFSKAFKTFYFTNPIALVKGLHCRPLSYKLPTILEHSKETWSWSWSQKNSGLQACNVTEKWTVVQNIFWSFRKFRTSFPFLALPEKYHCFFSPIVGCRLYSCNCIKRELHYLCFLHHYPRKSLWWTSILVATYNVSKNGLAHRCFLSVFFL